MASKRATTTPYNKKTSSKNASGKPTPPPKTDPFAAREANQYENPVPSREFILSFLESAKRPYSHPDMCQE